MRKADGTLDGQNSNEAVCGSVENQGWNPTTNLAGFPSWPAFVHVVLVVVAVWFAGVFQYNLIVVLGIAVLYLLQVDCIQRKRAFEEAKMSLKLDAICAKTTTDAETVVWVNGILQKAWGIWLERFASQQLIMKVAPWFLDHYKPWALKSLKLKAVNLGNQPPVVESARLHRVGSDTEDVVLEMDVSFVAANDMFLTVVSKLTKPGLSFPCVVSKVILSGKVRVGITFLAESPFMNRISLSFVSSPAMSMKVNVLKSSLSKGFDVASFPLVASLVDSTVEKVLGESLITPNMLIVNLPEVLAAVDSSEDSDSEMMKKELATSPKPSGDSKMSQETLPSLTTRVSAAAGHKAVATVQLEIIEGKNLKAGDSTGLSDPLVKLTLGRHKRRTKTIKQTLNPKWEEKFQLPISNWNSPRHAHIVTLRVMDHDDWKHDDKLGECSIDLADYRDGKRADFWMKLENTNRGEIHVAVTITKDGGNVDDGEDNRDNHTQPSLTIESVAAISLHPGSDNKTSATESSKASVASGTKREKHEAPSIPSHSASLKRPNRLMRSSSSLGIKHRRTLSLDRPASVNPVKAEVVRAHSCINTTTRGEGLVSPRPLTISEEECKDNDFSIASLKESSLELLSLPKPPQAASSSGSSRVSTTSQKARVCDVSTGPYITRICQGVTLQTWYSLNQSHSPTKV